jgi:hypothetical protein
MTYNKTPGLIKTSTNLRVAQGIKNASRSSHVRTEVSAVRTQKKHIKVSKSSLSVPVVIVMDFSDVKQ